MCIGASLFIFHQGTQEAIGMVKERFSFEFIEKKMRKKNFGILSTITKDGRPHSTGILYGVSPPDEIFSLYVMTGKRYQKTKNIQRNQDVAFVIPYPHYWLRFVPPNAVSFQGFAEILPSDDPIGVKSFQDSRILRMNLEESSNDSEDMVFIRIVPDKKIHVYGLGISLMELRRSHTEGSYYVKIPSGRMDIKD
ncbi:MAG: hypothetical protein BAJATHORv1_70117 [Candidatus Thorarchaeota archaeon]|nr:MAG: hypothetical protein BAJATHORv1_70117 [Candidatus Thorarchaeota archaeon]